MFASLLSLLWVSVPVDGQGWPAAGEETPDKVEQPWSFAPRPGRRPHEPARVVKTQLSTASSAENPAPSLRQPSKRRRAQRSNTCDHVPESSPHAERTASADSAPTPATWRPGRSRAARYAIPVVVFLLACASPVGGSQTCYVAPEQFVLAAGADRSAPTLTTTDPAASHERRTKTSGVSTRLMKGSESKSGKDQARSRVGPRSPP